MQNPPFNDKNVSIYDFSLAVTMYDRVQTFAVSASCETVICLTRCTPKITTSNLHYDQGSAVSSVNSRSSLQNRYPTLHNNIAVRKTRNFAENPM